MKKVYREPKYKSHSARKAKRNLKKRQNKNRRRPHCKKRVHRFREPPSGLPEILAAPEFFDMIDNPDETIEFFNALFSAVRGRRRVFLNLSGVEHLAPNSLLYILSQFKKWESRGLQHEVSGNEPRNEVCRTMLRQSGFYKYLTSHLHPEVDSPDILKIEEGREVDGELAGRVLNLCGMSVHSPDPESRKTYTSIVELMGNTREHANPESKEHLYWYLMAVVDRKDSKIRISFLDNGAGIPKTLRKKPLELVEELLARVFSIETLSESALILSSLKGEVRSRTKEGHRGKGLPSIYNGYNLGILNELVIISNKGYVNLADNDIRDLPRKFLGTLFCWTIPMRKGVDNDSD